jgi:hypothetical protein
MPPRLSNSSAVLTELVRVFCAKWVFFFVSEHHSL